METRRPDGRIYKIKQKKIGCSVGFVQVEPEKIDSSKQHEDIICVVVFCKNALENQSSKTMIAIQAVDGLYLMLKIYSFEIAKNLNQLSHLISSFDRLKQIMICSKDNCVEIQDKTRKRNLILDIPELHWIISI